MGRLPPSCYNLLSAAAQGRIRKAEVSVKVKACGGSCYVLLLRRTSISTNNLTVYAKTAKQAHLFWRTIPSQPNSAKLGTALLTRAAPRGPAPAPLRGGRRSPKPPATAGPPAPAPPAPPRRPVKATPRGGRFVVVLTLFDKCHQPLRAFPSRVEGQCLMTSSGTPVVDVKDMGKKTNVVNICCK